ncbi:hypothetical protein [Actinophytocola sp.]|uniref:hypothetical protein n=1 Tax=Actinophytocola sp. TaxID=1872138 RepID=UPI002D8114F9|nr:hypothetical protein [Actinophytocola sp.]HET9142267.1 hypothetical protein [Actinophytocola sp.]
MAEVVAILRAGPQELGWTSYAAVDDLVEDLRQFTERAVSGDAGAALQLRVLFAATGALQTASIDSGWAETFLDLAERFDRESAGL